ncbi:MAG: hypothetical protein QGH83_11190 [Candidatus Pacebacteria bacterium]|jgi:hypothetical protein|nr:hypothetical protein [Candidatus Paceibacterota bacterium]|tara:strand:+ start:55 stop:492 length:438 start_codon:yes stop_codon:yes gene_type:complete
MPVCLTTTQTRPETGVKFYRCSEEFKNYRFTAYRVQLGNTLDNLTGGDSSLVEIWPRVRYFNPADAEGEFYWLSNNDLTVTYKAYFKDRETYTRFSEDSQIAALLRVPWDAYNEANNITCTQEVEEVDSVPDIPPEYLKENLLKT